MALKMIWWNDRSGAGSHDAPLPESWADEEPKVNITTLFLCLEINFVRILAGIMEEKIQWMSGIRGRTRHAAFEIIIISVYDLLVSD